MINIAPLNQTQQGVAFYALYSAYIDELSQYIRQYGNPYIQPQPWWVEDPYSRVHVAQQDEQLVGFVINGWGSRVDGDTESEILEFYVAPAFRQQGLGRRLAWVGLTQLWGQAGFQVYFDNRRAEHFWHRALTANEMRYTTYPALESNIPVIKYRFLGQKSTSDQP